MKNHTLKTKSDRIMLFRNPIAKPLNIDSLDNLKRYFEIIMKSKLSERKKDLHCRLLLESFLKQENLTIVKENLEFTYEMKNITNYDVNESENLS